MALQIYGNSIISNNFLCFNLESELKCTKVFLKQSHAAPSSQTCPWRAGKHGTNRCVYVLLVLFTSASSGSFVAVFICMKSPDGKSTSIFIFSFSKLFFFLKFT